MINERVVGGYVTEWKQFRFRDGIIQAMTALAKLALPMVVVSNQAGVGKCLLSSRALEILRSDLSQSSRSATFVSTPFIIVRTHPSRAAAVENHVQD